MFGPVMVLEFVIKWPGINIDEGVSVDELENIAINVINDAYKQYLDMKKRSIIR
jgi:hypothetical protein